MLSSAGGFNSPLLQTYWISIKISYVQDMKHAAKMTHGRQKKARTMR